MKSYQPSAISHQLMGKVTISLLISVLCLLVTATAWAEENPMAKGIQFAKEKKYSEALVEFRKAQAEDPSNPNIRYNIALVLDLQGNTDEAVKEYKATIRTYPLSNAAFRAHGKLARIYKLMGKAEESKKEIAESLRLMNENTSLKMSKEEFARKVEEKYSAIK